VSDLVVISKKKKEKRAKNEEFDFSSFLLSPSLSSLFPLFSPD
jgi:hypothetical protein